MGDLVKPEDVQNAFEKASAPGTKRLSFDRFVSALVYISRIRYPNARIINFILLYIEREVTLGLLLSKQIFLLKCAPMLAKGEFKSPLSPADFVYNKFMKFY